jgi:hypothetical protein
VRIKCTSCGKEDELTNFPKRKESKTGYRSQCKDCRYNYHRKYRREHYIQSTDYQKEYQEKNKNRFIEYKKDYYLNNKSKRLTKNYGLSLEEYNSLLLFQKNMCAICETEFSNGNNPHVDHCHITNKVRGLLCRQCNLLLGHAKDDTDILIKSINYLGT